MPASEGADCDDDACAPDGAARRRTRRLFVVAVTLFAVAIAYPHVIAALL